MSGIAEHNLSFKGGKDSPKKTPESPFSSKNIHRILGKSGKGFVDKLIFSTKEIIPSNIIHGCCWQKNTEIPKDFRIFHKKPAYYYHYDKLFLFSLKGGKNRILDATHDWRSSL